jgi:hypothetical protein
MHALSSDVFFFNFWQCFVWRGLAQGLGRMVVGVGVGLRVWVCGCVGLVGGWGSLLEEGGEYHLV